MWLAKQSSFLATVILVVVHVEAGYHYQVPARNPNNYYNQPDYRNQPQRTYYNTLVNGNAANVDQNRYTNVRQTYRNQETPFYNQQNSQYNQRIQTQLPLHNLQQNPSQHVNADTYLRSGSHVSQVTSQVQSNFNQPTIKKHIYFHVPPPDLEPQTPQVHNSYVPKKNYKIIFIKLPSQSRNSNLLQNQIYNEYHQQQQPIEEKTLIYVLVKKHEPYVAPQPVNTVSSNPEVFYVKYKQNSPVHDEDIATEVNAGFAGGEVEEVEEVVEEVLEPGLVNGKDISYTYDVYKDK